MATQLGPPWSPGGLIDCLLPRVQELLHLRELTSRRSPGWSATMAPTRPGERRCFLESPHEGVPVFIAPRHRRRRYSAIKVCPLPPSSSPCLTCCLGSHVRVGTLQSLIIWWTRRRSSALLTLYRSFGNLVANRSLNLAHKPFAVFSPIDRCCVFPLALLARSLNVHNPLHKIPATREERPGR